MIAATEPSPAGPGVQAVLNAAPRVLRTLGRARRSSPRRRSCRPPASGTPTAAGRDDGGARRAPQTPGHLEWCAALTRALPWLKVVVIVRDPRAVVASRLEAPWRPQRRDSYALATEKWRLDQDMIAGVLGSLGKDRCLELHYEQMVADPDGTRSAIAQLLEIDRASMLRTPDPAELYFPWEESWKSRAVGEITVDRVHAWKKKLPPRVARRIEAICRTEMIRAGYPTELSPLGARVVRLAMSRERTSLASWPCGAIGAHERSSSAPRCSNRLRGVVASAHAGS